MSKSIVNRIDKNLARRLKEARREIGLSTRAVSGKLPNRLTVSHTTIASYENGVALPPIDVLAALSSIYGRPINWFLESRDTLSDFRYFNLQCRVPLSEQRTYAAQAGKWIEGYLALESYLKHGHQQRHVDPHGTTPEALAKLIRQEYLNLDDSHPVQDTVALLESFSTWAIELRADFRCDGAAGQFGNRSVVVINPNTANERIRFHMTHELAYLLYSQSAEITPPQLEQQAQTFASCLIIPDSQLQEAFRGRSFLKLIEYKERFGTSLSAMIHRAESLGIINSTASRWLRSEIVKRGWRRQEPGYVWRDRALSFESILESAIGLKTITWEDAERVTAIPAEELKKRLLNATAGIEIPDERNEEVQSIQFGNRK